jgi:hypothetical protein
MNTSTAHTHYREVVAQVDAKAREKLPQAVNGRIESAVKLVLAHDVHFCDDGTIEVGSASDPLKTYTLAGQACDCQDFACGRALGGWCQHRIAAGIAKRVGELLPPAPAPIPAPPPVEPWPDNDPEPEPEATVPATVAPVESPAVLTTLPEAPASVNCHLTIAGRQVQLTLRDTDESRLLARLEAVLARFPLPEAPAASQGQLSAAQHNAAAMHRKVTDFCKIHNVAMKQTTKNGRSWWSHRVRRESGMEECRNAFGYTGAR